MKQKVFKALISVDIEGATQSELDTISAFLENEAQRMGYDSVITARKALLGEEVAKPRNQRKPRNLRGIKKQKDKKD